jgi:hypothetical protein
LEPDELLSTVRQSEALLSDELAHQGQACPDPSSATSSAITDSDLAAMRSKFPFLRDFSDGFIRATKPDCILKMESTTLKIRESERSRDADDKLAANRAALGTSPKILKEGADDRWKILHEGRFLPGAGCSAAKLWLTARSSLGLTGGAAIGNYDMHSVGLGGFVSAKGWVELANPSSTKLSLRQFSLNNCSSKVSNKKGDTEEESEFSELGELQLALRTLRTAASFVSPWNMSFTAIENFLVNNKFCKDDLQGVEKQAALLCQFVDYVLLENANKWRDCEPFLSSGDLKNAWQAFFSARPQSSLSRKKTEQSSNQRNGSFKQPFQKSQQQAFRNKFPQKLPFIDACYRWNRNQCQNPAGSCTSPSGQPLRHVCDQRTDPNNLTVFCGQNHKRVDFH